MVAYKHVDTTIIPVLLHNDGHKIEALMIEKQQYLITNLLLKQAKLTTFSHSQYMQLRKIEKNATQQNEPKNEKHGDQSEKSLSIL
jgi:hypothetical protein